jgi:ASC-1-like (ASCH) protein
MKKGDYILFTNNEFNFPRSFLCKITSIHNYDSFEKYLKSETLEKCLPGIDSLEQGVSIYHKYYTKEDEAKYKIKAFRLKI